MKTSSRFVVAVHSLTALDLAPVIKRKETLSSEEIAESVNTHPVVIRRLLSSLRKAGLVTSQTGPGGGSKLARHAEQITLLEVYQMVEDGRLFHLHYNTSNQACPIDSNIQGVMDAVFSRAENAVAGVLSEVTVAQVSEAISERS